MTGESAKETDPWMKKNGAKYAYAYDKGLKLAGELGNPGFPHAFLIDASGKVVWEGHPGELKSSNIESALTGALPKAMWDWPASAKDARTALAKHKYADALAAAAKVPDTDFGPGIQAAIKGVIAKHVTAMKAALTAGDFLTANDEAAELQVTLAGLPEQAEAKTVADTIKANKDAPPIIKALKSIRAAKAEEYKSSKQFEKGIEAMKKIAKDLPGTFAEKEAKDFQEQLDKMRRQKT